MRKAVAFAKKVVEWELLIVNLRPYLAEMPFLQSIVTDLEALVAEGKALNSVQEIARGQLQDSVHRRQGVEKTGEVLRRRAASLLRGTLGFSSDDLVKFGVRPRKTGPRGPRTPKTPPATTP